MKRTITGIALVLALVFTATAWSQEPPMERGKMGKGKMGMGKMETEEMEMGGSSEMKACMQMMGETETTDAALDELVERMQAADGAEKMAVMEELLTALVAQRREVHKRMRGMPKMTCGGMMGMMMQ
jgi:hypothetical protein